MNDHIGFHEIIPGNTEAIHWSPKSAQGVPNPLGIFIRRLDPYVDVSGRPRNSVKCQSVSSDNEESCARGCQSTKKIFEIGIHSRSSSREKFLTGISDLRYVGNGFAPSNHISRVSSSRSAKR